jgi:hypothetical protein
MDTCFKAGSVGPADGRKRVEVDISKRVEKNREKQQRFAESDEFVCGCCTATRWKLRLRQRMHGITINVGRVCKGDSA